MHNIIFHPTHRLLDKVHMEFIVSFFCFICLLHCVPNRALVQRPIVEVMPAISLCAARGQQRLHYSSHCSLLIPRVCGVYEWPSSPGGLNGHFFFMITIHFLKLILQFILKAIRLQDRPDVK